MGRRTRQRKRKQRVVGEGYRQRMQELELLEGDVRELASRRGMELRANRVVCSRTRGTETFHWMFNDGATGRRIVDYWPTNGKWWCQQNGERGTVLDPLEMIEVASKLAVKVGL